MVTPENEEHTEGEGDGARRVLEALVRALFTDDGRVVFAFLSVAAEVDSTANDAPDGGGSASECHDDEGTFLLVHAVLLASDTFAAVSEWRSSSDSGSWSDERRVVSDVSR